MEISKLLKAKELYAELEEIRSYKKLFKRGEYKDATHFIVAQHYGSNLSNYEKVNIPKRYNGRFKELLDIIINEVEIELDEM